jgi:hypothetical protein
MNITSPNIAVGNNPEQVPRNADLGAMAYQDESPSVDMLQFLPGTGGVQIRSFSADPTVDDIPSGAFILWKNTTTGTLALWANDNGTMRSFPVLTSAGHLVSAYANPVYYLNDTSGSGTAEVRLQSNGVTRWSLQKSAANNLNIARYDASGAFIDNPLSIDVTTGNVAGTAGFAAAGKVRGVNSANLLLNGSAELGNLGWNLTNFAATQGASGEGPIFLNGAAITSGTNMGDLSGPIAIGAGVTLSLSCEITTVGLTAGRVYVNVEAFNSSGVSLGAFFGTALVTAAAGWTFYSASGTTPANTAYVIVRKAADTNPRASAFGVGMRRIKLEVGSAPSLYSDDATAQLLSLTHASVIPAANRNHIVDGNFDYVPGVTSESLSGNSNGRTVFPMYYASLGVGGVGSWAQAAFNGAEDLNMTSPAINCAVLTATTASTGVAGSTAPFIMQRMESAKRLHGRSATYSVWVRTTGSAFTITQAMWYQNFGTGGSPSATVAQNITVNWPVDATWRRYSVRMDFSSVNGKTFGTNGNDFMQVGFWLPVGSTFNVITAQWQLEETSALAPAAGLPTKFEYRGEQAEIARCQRLYEAGRSYLQGYSSGAGGTIQTYFSWLAQKRAVPAVNVAYVAANFSNVSGSAGLINAPSLQGMRVGDTVTAAGTGYALFDYIADCRL